MLQAGQFDISMVQCAIFTPNIVFRLQNTLAYLLEQWGNKFNGKPLTMPLPDDAPTQIPSIILVSEDNNFKIEISKARTNIYWNKTSDAVEPNVQAIVSEFTDILQKFAGHLGVSPGRLAFILHRFMPIENPAKALAEHFCKETWLTTALNRPEKFELHSHKAYTLAGQFNVNSWTRVKTGRMVADNSPAIIVEQDINTLAEELESKQFEAGQMQTFFNEAANESDQIIALYFP